MACEGVRSYRCGWNGASRSPAPRIRRHCTCDHGCRLRRGWRAVEPLGRAGHRSSIECAARCLEPLGRTRVVAGRRVDGGCGSGAGSSRARRAPGSCRHRAGGRPSCCKPCRPWWRNSRADARPGCSAGHAGSDTHRADITNRRAAPAGASTARRAQADGDAAEARRQPARAGRPNRRGDEAAFGSVDETAHRTAVARTEKTYGALGTRALWIT
jgi:hypothetical protein